MPCITLGEFEYLTAYLDTWAHENDSLLNVSSGVIRLQKKLDKQKKPYVVLKRNVLASICSLSQPSPSSDTLEMTSAVEAFYSLLFSLLPSVAHVNPPLYSLLLLSNLKKTDLTSVMSLFCCFAVLCCFSKEQIKPAHSIQHIPHPTHSVLR